MGETMQDGDVNIELQKNNMICYNWAGTHYTFKVVFQDDT